MARRDLIIEFMDDLLDSASFQDHGPNGLQVPGAEEVSLLATGVSANRQTIELAIAAGAQMLLCHHGLFWEGAPIHVTPGMKGRLAPLLAADMSLAAQHLPLDANAGLGNNSLLCDLMGFERAEPFAVHRGNPIGFVGRSDEGIAIGDLAARLEAGLGRVPLIQGAGPATVRSIGVVSGAAAGDLRTAIAAGLDAFITGEPAEWAMAEATEAGVHFIAAGHYATETLGVRKLGEAVAERFGVDHQFIDVPNSV
jgi:dinuclear metal center YbgI/SA1388 family protein